MPAAVQIAVAAAPPCPDALLQTARQVQAIVDDAEPALLNITINRVRREVAITHRDVLECVVRAIFEMITRDSIDSHEHDCSRHARCGETYADVVFAMRALVPTSHIDGDESVTFTSIVLNVSQDAFEEWCAKFVNAHEKAEACDEKTLNKLMALVSFIGQLYVRRLLAARVMAQVVHDLIGVRDRRPVEPLIRCVCELMQCIGQAIDANKQGGMLMTQFLARLSNLAATQQAETREPFYSQEIRDAIRAVHEARFQNWPARADTMVFVQYHIVVSDCAATEIWHELKNSEQLPPDQMQLPSPRSTEAGGEHLRISAVISGRTIAILFSQNAAAMDESRLRQDIAAATCIHAQRLMIFEPFGKLFSPCCEPSAEHA